MKPLVFVRTSELGHSPEYMLMSSFMNVRFNGFLTALSMKLKVDAGELMRISREILEEAEIGQ